MDLLLGIVAFALANIALFAPVSPQLARGLQVVLVGVLALVVLLRIFQLRQITEKPVPREAKPQPGSSAAPSAAAAVPLEGAVEGAVEAGVVQFLARLQDKGRLVDFLMDDISPYSNEQIGVVARVVHQGCREVVRGSFQIEPVHQGREQEPVVLASDFDAGAYRLVGRVPDHPPYQGTVLHRGWKATRITLPRVTDTSLDSIARRIITPAEVQVG